MSYRSIFFPSPKLNEDPWASVKFIRISHDPLHPSFDHLGTLDDALKTGYEPQKHTHFWWSQMCVLPMASGAMAWIMGLSTRLCSSSLGVNPGEGAGEWVNAVEHILIELLFLYMSRTLEMQTWGRRGFFAWLVTEIVMCTNDDCQAHWLAI